MCVNKFYVSVNVVDGEVLHIVKISRLHMGAYLCIASNGVPPSVSKRVLLRVQCELLIFSRYLMLSRNFYHTYKMFAQNLSYSQSSRET